VGKSGGISQSTQDAEIGIAQQQTDIAQSANQRAGQLFQASFPGFEQSEQYYQQLASGDPAAIARAIAPATQQINEQADASKKRIEQDAPRGGTKNLALEENDINKGAQVGNLATQSYLGSFQNLAGLAGQGVGESTSQTGTAINGLSAAGNQYSNVANQEAEGKASQLGFISSLAGSGASLAALCWIAEELWGKESYKTFTMRRYFRARLHGHWLGRYAYRMYARYGEGVAEEMRHSPLLRSVMRWIFNRLLWMAERAVFTVMELEVAHGGRNSAT